MSKFSSIKHAIQRADQARCVFQEDADDARGFKRGDRVVLLEYLESAEFKQNPPQVLVWQLFEATYNQGPKAEGFWDNASIMTADTWRKRLHAAVGR